MPYKTFIIGVTGGVGSGKSTFVRMLQKLGADILDADDLARQLVEERVDVREDIRKAFGEAYFDATGAIQRRELGRLVFSNPVHLQKLNGLVWPLLFELLKNNIQSWRSATNQGILIVDMAILFEANAEPLFDQTILITAPEAIRMDRLRSSRQWSDDEIRQRMQSQLSDSEKKSRADCVIENSGSFNALKQQAKSQIDAWMKSNLN